MASPLCGVLVIDKPAGMTSSDVVQRVRRRLAVRRAGHTGTLDPLATGVLPVCLGEATKIAGLLLAEDKAYAATAVLGVETDTLDITGRVLRERDASAVERAAVEAALPQMLGPQQQVPPAFSAVHKDGQRAYERARRGEAVELAPRAVTIERLELTCWEPPRLELLVECSKGTYVRSLVAELGGRLGCGATLAGLRRLRSGAIDLTRAVTLDELEQRRDEGRLPLLAMDEALGHLGVVEIDAVAAIKLRQGQPVPCVGAPPGRLRVRCGGALLALGERRGDQLWPTRVFVAFP
jgi:tRNA pseudouridine55 synthase